MRDVLQQVERRTTALALWCAAAMLAVAALIGLYQILSRFVFEQPAEWSEVSIRFALIWMVFLGIPMACREGAMVSVDLLYRKAGPRLRRVLDGIILIAGLILMVTIVWFGFDYAWRARFQTISGLESFSMTWAYLAMPVGGVFSIIALFAHWFDPRRHELEVAQ